MKRSSLAALLPMTAWACLWLGCADGVVGTAGDDDPGGGVGGQSGSGSGGSGGSGGAAGKGGSGGSGGSGGGAAGSGGSGSGGSGGSGSGGSGGSGGSKELPPGSWSDPYPAAPDANDAGWVGQDHVGPKKLRYRLLGPGGDTSKLPLIVTSGRSAEYASSAIVIDLYYPDTEEDSDYWSYVESIGLDSCSPVCSMFRLLGGDNLKTVLKEVATHVAFDHKNVIMVGNNECEYPISLALRSDIQPFFSGATCMWSEWQMASCSSVASGPATTASPRVFQGVGKCDHSFCPQMGCYESIKKGGFDVTIAQDATYDTCTCPPPGGSPGKDRPHALGASPAIYAAHKAFIFSTPRP